MECRTDPTAHPDKSGSHDLNRVTSSEYCSSETSEYLRNKFLKEKRSAGISEDESWDCLLQMDRDAGFILCDSQSIFRRKPLLEELRLRATLLTDIFPDTLEYCYKNQHEHEFCKANVEFVEMVKNAETGRFMDSNQIQCSIRKELVKAGFSREDIECMIPMFIRGPDARFFDFLQIAECGSKIFGAQQVGLHMRLFLAKCEKSKLLEVDEEGDTTDVDFELFIGYPSRKDIVQHLYGQRHHFFPCDNPDVERKFTVARQHMKTQPTKGMQLASEAILQCTTNAPFKVKLFPGGTIHLADKRFIREINSKRKVKECHVFSYAVVEAEMHAISGDWKTVLEGWELILKLDSTVPEHLGPLTMYQVLRKYVIACGMANEARRGLDLINELMLPLTDDCGVEYSFWRSILHFCTRNNLNALSDMLVFLDGVPSGHEMYTRALYILVYIISTFPGPNDDPAISGLNPHELWLLAERHEKSMHGGEMMNSLVLKTKVKVCLNSFRHDGTNSSQPEPAWLSKLRGMYLTEPFSAEDIDRRETPSIFDALYNTEISTKAVCDVCNTPPLSGGKIHLCKRCRAAKYCGPACQKKDWKNGHKQQCPLMKMKAFGKSF